MQKLTGSRDISATSIKSYFEPLIEWLKKENEEASRKAGRNVVGWQNERIKWSEGKAHHFTNDIDIILDELIESRKLKKKN